jgi:hypothetical protein
MVFAHVRVFQSDVAPPVVSPLTGHLRKFSKDREDKDLKLNFGCPSGLDLSLLGIHYRVCELFARAAIM